MRRTARAAGLAAASAAVLALSGCLGDVDVPTPSVTATAPSPSATASGTASPTPSATPSDDRNDPGDGVATDDPIATPTPTGDQERATVNVSLTRYGTEGGSFVAAAVIAGVVESTGTCTMTLTSGATTLTASGAGAPSATTTDCAAGLAIPLSSLSSGTWTLVISYDSAGFAGSSSPEQVTIS